jgi:hypothetical protein
MIDAFHADDFVAQRRVMRVNVFDQVELGVRRADDEDFLRAFQCLDHFMIEVLVFRRAACAHCAAFVVQMVMGSGGANHRGFDIVWADVHHMGFGMVDPNNGVVVRHDRFPSAVLNDEAHCSSPPAR